VTTSPYISKVESCRAGRAFTLIEIMVVVTLMTVMILGLVAMFNQTQKAFKAGMTQVDVLEAGRMATDLIAREMQEMTPSSQFATMNFWMENPPFNSVPLTLPVSPGLRTNVLNEFYFLTRNNQKWIGIGYRIYPANTGIGTLYRYTQSTNLSVNPEILFRNFRNTSYSNLSQVLDGIIQFRIRAYETNGAWLTELNRLQQSPSFQNNTFILHSDFAWGENAYYALSNKVVPAYVEMELGILEPGTLNRYKSIPIPTTQTEFLKKQANHVHLFRQRIAIRNLDPSAYQ
jgi:hypothetical protein